MHAHLSNKYFFLVLAVAFLFSLSSSSFQTQPKESVPPAFQAPQADQFTGLPFHLIGEIVEANGYIIQVESIGLDPEAIRVSATLTNNTDIPIDLSTALKLYAPDGAGISPEDEEGTLNPGASRQQEFVYKLSDNFVREQIMDYRLLYTPFGWSGPVIVYLLVDALPDVSPPATVAPDMSSAVYNGITGDPWKMLILIYPNIDTDYVENGVAKHLSAQMPAADLAAMRADFINNQPHRKTVYDYSGNTAEMEANVIIVNRPLTNLEPINGGFWPSPDVTRQELNLYAPKGTYDSVIVFWQASNPTTGQSLPVYGWGLGYWPGETYANGMTYATVFNINWVWPTDQCHGEVFLHEWLHGVTGYYMSLGFPFNVEDLHGAEEAGYQWDFDQDGCWDMWLRDYMRGLVYENGQRKALIPETWQSGSITTHTISGWRGEYFDNETLSGIPVLVRDDPEINFDWQSNSPHPFVPADYFSIRWTKTIHFNSSDYKFDLLRDDGIRLKIDGITILDAWTDGREWASATTHISEGDHVVVVETYENTGWAAAIFQYVDLFPVLSVSTTGHGSGSVTSSPAGISCGSICSSSFSYNTPVTLTANATSVSKFTGWSGGNCSGTGTCTVTMTTSQSVTANFDPFCADCGPANSTWPLYRQNLLHTGYSSLAGFANPSLAWSYYAGSSGSSSPVIGPDNTIYVGLGNKIYAFYPTGAVKWNSTTGGLVKSPALAANGTIYAASGDGKLNAFNADGTLRWSYTSGGWISASPAISPDGVVYIGSSDSKFYAIWPDGVLKWSYTIGSWQNPSPAIGPDGTIYQGSTTWNVYALTPDGTLKWQYSTGGYVDASPALGTDGTIYIGSCDNSIYAINSNGTLKWKYATGGVAGSPGIGPDGTIYVGSADNYLYAMKPDGTFKWRYLTGGYVGAPSIDGTGIVYVGSHDGYLYAINPSGSLEWRIFLGGWLESNPVLGPNQTIYTTDAFGKIYAVVSRYALSVSKAGNGSGTVTSSPAGITCGSTCSTLFTYNTPVTLTAAASTGSTFTGWSGGGCSGTGTCTVAVTEATSVTANFTLSTYALTVSKTGTGSGTVTSSPAGITCGATCSYSFNYNTSVTLTAAASAGSAFAGWSGGGCSGTGTCTVAVTAATSVTAAFTPGTSYSLSVSKAGTGSGTVTSSPSGINCGSTCTYSFANNTSVTLTAAASTGSNFTGWSGGGCSGAGTCTVSMTAATSVTATFTLNTYALTISKTGTGSGTVTSSPAGITCGATCSYSFSYNTSVTLTAAASTGSTFAGWSGGGCSGTGTCTVAMTAATSVSANFSTVTSYNLSVGKVGTGDGTVTSSPAGISCGSACSNSFANNTSVTLTAAASTGSAFTGWSGGGCSGTSTCTVSMTAATSVTATFTLNTYALTISKTGTGSGTVTSSPAGITCGATCSYSFNYNTSVTLAAVATTGSNFTGWSGGGCSGTSTCTVNIAAATSVTATFTLNTYAMTIGKTGTGSGTVTSSPAGITCGATCAYSFNNNTSVTLAAAASTGSTFTGWSGGGCSGISTCTVSMTAATSVTAAFTLNTYALTISKAGTGSGTVTSSPAGITCGATCSSAFSHGTSVALTASAPAGSYFTGWSGGGCSGTGPCTVSITAATAVTANFTLGTSYTLTVDKTGAGSGMVTSNLTGISCGYACSSAFPNGTNVTLTAAASTGSAFSGWSGGGCSGTGTCTLAITSAAAVTANFTLKTYVLTVNNTGAGSGTVTSSPAGITCGSVCSYAFLSGTTINLSAVPSTGSAFTGWSGDASGTSNPLQITIFGDVTTTANFETITFSDVPFTYSETLGGVSYPLYSYIQALYDAGYTGGCLTTPTLQYCPTKSMNRAESAVFMLRGVYGGGYGTSAMPGTPPASVGRFKDNWSGSVAWATGWAEGMWQAGLTAGCQTNPQLLFCPATTFPRVQAAVFGLRLKYGAAYGTAAMPGTPPAASGTLFADNWSSSSISWGLPWAEKAYNDGLLVACGTSGGKPLFCPNDALDRAWAAYLVVKAKGLTLSP